MTDVQPPASPQKKKTVSVVGGVVSLFLVGLAGIIGRQLGSELMGSSSPRAGGPASQELLSKAADQMNRMLPMMVDKETELTSTIGLPGVFVYRYRLVTARFKELNPSDIEGMTDTLKPQLINGACTTPQTRDNLLRRGVTMRYMYNDQEGKFLASIDVKAADCGF